MEKIAMLASSLNDEYEFELNMSVAFDHAAENAQLLRLRYAEEHTKLKAVRQELEFIRDLRADLAAEQKKIDGLLQELGWAVIQSQQEKKETQKEEDEEYYW